MFHVQCYLSLKNIYLPGVARNRSPVGCLCSKYWVDFNYFRSSIIANLVFLNGIGIYKKTIIYFFLDLFCFVFNVGSPSGLPLFDHLRSVFLILIQYSLWQYLLDGDEEVAANLCIFIFWSYVTSFLTAVMLFKGIYCPLHGYKSTIKE